LQKHGSAAIEIVLPGQQAICAQVRLVTCRRFGASAGGQAGIVSESRIPASLLILEIRANAVLSSSITFGIECPDREAAIEAVQKTFGSLRQAHDLRFLDREGLFGIGRLDLQLHWETAQGLRRNHFAGVNGAVLELYEEQ